MSFTGLFLLISSCASIVSKSNWPVTINSHPSGAAISITNKKGEEVYKGSTPANLMLKSGAGFFGKQSYKITFQLSGYDTRVIPVECKMNGWYWGNILLGGIIGMLIVDPATGAMYKLETDAISQDLTKAMGSVETENQLKIYDINAIPKNMADHLVKIN